MKKRSCLLTVCMFLFCVLPSGIISGSEKDDSNWKGKLTEEAPVVINEGEGSVSFLAEVNDTYFYKPTRHAAVFADGSNGDKAVFRAFVDHKTFHDNLTKIGAQPGENMTLKNKEMTFVKGDILDVNVTWNGAKREYSLDEVIKDSNGKALVMRFGGNLSRALKKNTGCLLCLDSCPVGIVSNASYTYGAVEKRKEVAFTGNKDILPPDGTLVMITLKPRR